MSRPSRRHLLLAAAAAGIAGCAGATKRAAAPTTSAAPPTTATAPPSTTQAPSPHPTSTHHSGPATEVVHGSRNRGEVALTFHGAGPPALATALLAEAERAGAHVTVFAIGSWLEENPRLAARIRDGGHGLANHTYSHPSNMASLSAAAAGAEFARARAVLVSQTGGDGGYARPSAMDRATPTVLAAAGAAGYATVVSYDVDPSDYLDPGAAAVTSRALAAVRPGSVVSLHLGHQGTVDALPALLAGLRAKRLRAVTVADLLRP